MSHAKFSPSSSFRWLRCTAGMILPEREQSESSYAALGTCLHSLAEDILKGDPIRLEYDGITYSQEDMDQIVIPYVDYVKALECDQYYYEKKVEVTKECYGTADVIGYNKQEDTLHIVDLKCGRGIRVFAGSNNQLMTYAIGAINFFKKENGFTPSRILTHIVQPALCNMSSHEVSIDELKELRKNIIDTIERVKNKDVEFAPSEIGCRFCQHIAFCPELKRIANKAAQVDFENIDLSEGLKIVAILDKYVKAVKEESLKRMKQGKKIEGFKLVRSNRGIRKWRDEKDAVKWLLDQGIEEDKMYSKKFITPPQVEKLIKGVELEELVARNTPALLIVSEKDKRKAFNAAEEAKKDFS